MKRCYQDSTISFMQGQMCEQFTQKNDFKLNLLSTFFSDHITKHMIDFEDNCVVGPDITSLSTNEDKDRAFLKCKENWMRNLKDNVSQELELKARSLLNTL